MHTYSGDSAQVLIAFSLENCAMYYLSSFRRSDSSTWKQCVARAIWVVRLVETVGF